MSFESVYRVSARNSQPNTDSFSSLRQALGSDLPIGYREYATTLGYGALCTYLVVKMPDQIRSTESKDKELYRDLFARAGDCALDASNVAGLNATDFEQATVLAYAMAEAPIWFVTPARGPRLFELADFQTIEIEDGFFGLVARCAAEQQHEFPFFEPNNGRRRMRQLYVRPGVGQAGFVQAMLRRWGSDSIRCSRSSDGELYPHYFVSSIEGHIELHLDSRYNQVPSDSFFVRASYDIDSDADVSTFLEPLLLPTGGPHAFTGKPIWLP